MYSMVELLPNSLTFLTPSMVLLSISLYFNSSFISLMLDILSLRKVFRRLISCPTVLLFITGFAELRSSFSFLIVLFLSSSCLLAIRQFKIDVFPLIKKSVSPQLSDGGVSVGVEDGVLNARHVRLDLLQPPPSPLISCRGSQMVLS